MNKSKIVENISDDFVNLQAPRTSLGAFKNGSVGLFQVLTSLSVMHACLLYVIYVR